MMLWKKLSEKIVYNNFRKIKLVDFQMPDSTIKSFEILVEPGDVTSALVMTKDKKIILQKQFRPGPECFITDLPGGYIDKNETPEMAIEREVLEETGYKGEIIPITFQYVGAYSTLKLYIFLIKDAIKIKEPEHQDGEFIEILEMTLEGFKEHVRNGGIHELGGCYAVLDYLGELK